MEVTFLTSISLPSFHAKQLVLLSKRPSLHLFKIITTKAKQLVLASQRLSRHFAKLLNMEVPWKYEMLLPYPVIPIYKGVFGIYMEVEVKMKEIFYEMLLLSLDGVKSGFRRSKLKV